MQAVVTFFEWFFLMIPDFLMSEPICYVFGLFLLGLIIDLFKRLLFLK